MARVLTLGAFVAFTLATANVLTADWSPEGAARYLDERQKQWFEWKPAMSADGPCVSCHTGMTYLLARPMLRRVLKEDRPTVYEQGLLDRLRAHVGAKPPGALQEVESIFAAMFLAREDARGTMSANTQRAFEQLWTLQQSEGPAKGAWKWYAANLDPWEHSGSSYFGASLALLANRIDAG
jgi:squalene-hopene/tetraprenyl-beta-curcumene cyclase